MTIKKEKSFCDFSFLICVMELKIIFVTTYIHPYTPNNNLSTIIEHFGTHINLGSIV